jgi:hypothetical protein
MKWGQVLNDRVDPPRTFLIREPRVGLVRRLEKREYSRLISRHPGITIQEQRPASQQ